MKRITRTARLMCLALALTTAPALAEPAAEPTPTTYAAVYSAENPIPEIAANVRPSVVQVETSEEFWDPVTRVGSVTPLGSGSGCYIRSDDEGGYVLTNYHVVADGQVYTLYWLDGTEMDAELVGYDDGTDIAVLRFTDPAPADAQPIPLGDSDALQIGELVVAIGNPGSGDETLFGTVTAGIVSGLERSANADNFSRHVSVIQTDAAINSGNSGGALLNAKGELVGIPTLKYMYSYDVVYEGLGFCIPISAVSDYISQIIDNGAVVRPRMGVTVVALDGPDEPMKTIPPAGVQVVDVERRGPGDKAGMQSGDVIVEANGTRVYTFMDLSAELDKCEPGDEIELHCYRYYDEEGNPLSRYEEFTFRVKLEILD